MSLPQDLQSVPGVTRNPWIPDTDPDQLFWIQTHPILASRRRIYHLYQCIANAPAKTLLHPGRLIGQQSIPLPHVNAFYDAYLGSSGLNSFSAQGQAQPLMQPQQQPGQNYSFAQEGPM